VERLLNALALVLATLAFAPSAYATSDAGPPNQSCTDGGVGEWMGCGSHTDCPGDQRCLASGVCGCSDYCAYGETCSASGCRCNGPPDAAAPGYDSGVPMCTTDGGPQIECASDADCAGEVYVGVTLVCGGNGVCVCPSEDDPPRYGEPSGCSAHRGGGSGGAAMLLVGLALVGSTLAVRKRR
jgi:hypothetical protein